MVGNYPCFFDDLLEECVRLQFFRLLLSDPSRYASILDVPDITHRRLLSILFFFFFSGGIFSADDGRQWDAIFLGGGEKDVRFRSWSTLDLSLMKDGGGGSNSKSHALLTLNATCVTRRAGRRGFTAHIYHEYDH